MQECRDKALYNILCSQCSDINQSFALITNIPRGVVGIHICIFMFANDTNLYQCFNVPQPLVMCALMLEMSI